MIITIEREVETWALHINLLTRFLRFKMGQIFTVEPDEIETLKYICEGIALYKELRRSLSLRHWDWSNIRRHGTSSLYNGSA